MRLPFCSAFGCGLNGLLGLLEVLWDVAAQPRMHPRPSSCAEQGHRGKEETRVGVQWQLSVLCTRDPLMC